MDIRDAGDPVELAARYDAEGADELIFLDITASHERRDIIIDLAARCAEQVFIPFTIGGGLSSVDDVRAVLAAGADKVTMNTAAVQDPELVRRCAERFGAQCIVVAIDARRIPGSGEEGRPLAVGGLRARRAHAHGHRRDRVGGARGRAGRRRVHAHEHGPRRHARRLRPRAHARGGARGGGAGDRLRRRRHARAPRRGPHRGRGRRGAGGEHLPLRHLHHRRGQGVPRRAGRAGAAGGGRRRRAPRRTAPDLRERRAPHRPRGAGRRGRAAAGGAARRGAPRPVPHGHRVRRRRRRDAGRARRR